MNAATPTPISPLMAWVTGRCRTNRMVAMSDPGGQRGADRPAKAGDDVDDDEHHDGQAGVEHAHRAAELFQDGSGVERRPKPRTTGSGRRPTLVDSCPVDPVKLGDGHLVGVCRRPGMV